MRVDTVALASVRRPLQRFLDEDKVESLMASIRQEGLHEPIDLLEVDGQLWGFNGCHRVAAHERLGLPTIRARIRQATIRAQNQRCHLSDSLVFRFGHPSADLS